MHSRVLIAASTVFLIATAYVVVTYGESAYFVAFHKPLHFSLSSTTKPYVAPEVPTFQVKPSIAAASLTPGRTQTISVTITPSSTVSAYVEVWIEGPLHTQVFRSNTDGSPTSFVKGSPQTLTYHYTLPHNLPKGTYTVSAILTSPNNQTDYYVNTNFASFTVS